MTAVVIILRGKNRKPHKCLQLFVHCFTSIYKGFTSVYNCFNTVLQVFTTVLFTVLQRVGFVCLFYLAAINGCCCDNALHEEFLTIHVFTTVFHYFTSVYNCFASV